MSHTNTYPSYYNNWNSTLLILIFTALLISILFAIFYIIEICFNIKRIQTAPDSKSLKTGTLRSFKA